MASPSPSPYGVGAVVSGKFKIVRELGVGGMGAVYEVQHVLTHHRRALKVLRVDRDKSSEGTVRLLREASAAGRIGSAHIVETFDAGKLENGDPYVVMELLEGLSFADYMKRKRTMRIAEIATLVRQACSGLQAAHDAGIVHRDVKPANLFVVQKNGVPFVKILDFGVSKFDTNVTDSTELTRDGALIGTPSYMAPEQLRGVADVDARIDIYALGVLLYVATTGHRPFIGASFADLAIKIDRGEYTPVRERRPDAPAGFPEIVAKAMHRDRDQRYASLNELADALAPYELDASHSDGSLSSAGSVRNVGADPSRSDAVDSVARLEQPPNPWANSSNGSGDARPSLPGVPISMRPPSHGSNGFSGISGSSGMGLAAIRQPLTPPHLPAEAMRPPLPSASTVTVHVADDPPKRKAPAVIAIAAAICTSAVIAAVVFLTIHSRAVANADAARAEHERVAATTAGTTTPTSLDPSTVAATAPSASSASSGSSAATAGGGGTGNGANSGAPATQAPSSVSTAASVAASPSAVSPPTTPSRPADSPSHTSHKPPGSADLERSNPY